MPPSALAQATDHTGAHPRLVFDSLAAMVAWTRATPATWQRQSSISTDPSRVSWCQSASYDAAAALLSHGWPEGRDKIADALTTAHRLQAPEPALAPGYDVGGAYPCVPMAVAGEPACMVSPTASIVEQRPVVEIWSDLSMSAATGGAAILHRGAAILAWIDALETSGYRVSLTFVDYSTKRGGASTYSLRVQAKRPDQPMELDRLAFVLMHPSMLRRLQFATMERCPGIESAMGEGSYGSVTDWPSADVPPGVIYLPPIAHDNRHSYATQEGANARVRAALVAAGVLAE